jgi:hypothetical protein
MLVITVVLSATAIYAAAKVTRKVMDRFGLDPITALLWLGLAEWPSDPRPPR